MAIGLDGKKKLATKPEKEEEEEEEALGVPLPTRS